MVDLNNTGYGRSMIIAVSIVLLAGYVFMVAGEQGQSSTERFTGTGENVKKATFAGGCFWCMEPPFEKLDGVSEAVSGFTGGKVKDPAYKEVASGKTEHREAVRVYYDPSEVTYEQLLEVYWRQIDPTDADGQFVDRGFQYTTAIFVHNEKQRKLAEKSRGILSKAGIFDGPINTPILEATNFYRASDYHQDYYNNYSVRYKYYRYNSGRDDYLESTWEGHENVEIFPPSAKKPKTQMSRSREPSQPTPDHANRSYDVPGRDQLKEQLTDRQYRITQEDGTEPAYDNKYWDNKTPGIYVDVVSGEPLFSSTHKYKSGTGWPSFYKALEPDNIVTRTDDSLFMSRTEVRSKHADSHLGHVFEDGPDPTGLRYCINSAALDFVPADQLEKRGYGEYVSLFETDTDTLK